MSAVPVNKVSLLGYGRFGGALASLLCEAGIAVRALDPHAAPPQELRATTLADLTAGADVSALLRA